LVEEGEVEDHHL
jgi:hypothetical protein